MSELESETPEPGEDDDDEAGEDDETAQGSGDADGVEAAVTPQEPVSGPPEPLNDMEAEKRAATAEKRWGTFAKQISGLYEEDGQFLFECPLCPSQHKGFVDIRWAGRIPDELAQAVTSYMRGVEQVAYLPDPQTKRCARCGGYGKTQTGSLVPSNDLITCSACKGYGYTPPPTPGGNGYIEAAGIELPVAVGAGPLVDEETDNWGHPKLLPDGQANPNWGRQPQYVDPRYP